MTPIEARDFAIAAAAELGRGTPEATYLSQYGFVPIIRLSASVRLTYSGSGWQTIVGYGYLGTLEATPREAVMSAYRQCVESMDAFAKLSIACCDTASESVIMGMVETMRAEVAK